MAIATGANAAEELNVAGQNVDLTTSGNITGSDITINEGGKLYYDASTKTLTMKDVRIVRGYDNQRCITSSVDGLTIYIEGTVDFNSVVAAAIRLNNGVANTITGPGELTVWSGEEAVLLSGGSTLRFSETTATLEGYGESVDGSGRTSGSCLVVANSFVTLDNKSKGNSIKDLGEFVVSGLSEVTVKGNSSKAVIDGLGELSLYDGIGIYHPSQAQFDTSKHTIITAGSTSAYKGDAVLTALVQVLPRYFLDDAFRSYINAQDYADNGIINSERVAVKEINVNEMGIADLTGVELFPNLEKLYCEKNSITALNMMKNTELMELNCNENQLTTLIVTKNTKLTKLYCEKNKLTTLDVTKNTELTELKCKRNQLTTLDVTKNTELTYLWCVSNQFTALDVSNNKELTRLYCYGNNIHGDNMFNLVTSLPRNTTTQEHEFRVFLSGSPDEHNVITNEQVRIAKALGWTPLWYINGAWKPYEGWDTNNIAINEENFPDYYFRRWLSQQDYGKDWVITQMERINISEINLMEISEYTGDYIESLKGIENFRNLKSLWFALIPVTSLDLSKNIILEDLQYWAPITELDVSNNINLKILTCMGYKGECLTSLDLSKNGNLTKLYCNGNNLNWLDLSNNWQLTELNCSENQLTGLDLSKNILLQKLYCQYNQLTTLDLSKTNEIDELKCYMNQIKDEGMDQLIASLTNRSIGETRFDVYYSGYDDTNDEYTIIDGNVVTKTQVAAAKKRGWVPYWYDDFDGKWKPYEGSGVDGDVNGDNVADVADIASIISVMAASIGDDIQSTAADLNHDGVVDVADIATVITIMAANARRLNIED